jgi:hypothetical protein
MRALRKDFPNDAPNRKNPQAVVFSRTQELRFLLGPISSVSRRRAISTLARKIVSEICKEICKREKCDCA